MDYLTSRRACPFMLLTLCVPQYIELKTIEIRKYHKHQIDNDMNLK